MDVCVKLRYCVRRFVPTSSGFRSRSKAQYGEPCQGVLLSVFDSMSLRIADGGLNYLLTSLIGQGHEERRAPMTLRKGALYISGKRRDVGMRALTPYGIDLPGCRRIAAGGGCISISHLRSAERMVAERMQCLCVVSTELTRDPLKIDSE